MVYIFGGGHVAQELVPLLTHLEFSCTVFDDREHFSSPRLFPAAAKCITGDFTRLSDYFEITPEDYVCIMTRGHQYDGAAAGFKDTCKVDRCHGKQTEKSHYTGKTLARRLYTGRTGTNYHPYRTEYSGRNSQ